ncbi:MAG: hypothetical protein ABI548_20445 [Polyangiaceae bacterium]
MKHSGTIGLLLIAVVAACGSSTRHFGAAPSSRSDAGAESEAGAAGSKTPSGSAGDSAAGAGGSENGEDAGSAGTEAGYGGAAPVGSGATTSGGAGGRAGAGGAQAGAGGNSGTDCNSVSLVSVSETSGTSTATAPAATHGTIVAGKYALTSRTFYSTDAAIDLLTSTAVVSVNDRTATIEFLGFWNFTTRFTIVIQTAEVSTNVPVSVSLTCGDATPSGIPSNLNLAPAIDYSASATEFSLRSVAQNGVLVDRYTKQ